MTLLQRWVALSLLMILLFLALFQLFARFMEWGPVKRWCQITTIRILFIMMTIDKGIDERLEEKYKELINIEISKYMAGY